MQLKVLPEPELLGFRRPQQTWLRFSSVRIQEEENDRAAEEEEEEKENNSCGDGLRRGVGRKLSLVHKEQQQWLVYLKLKNSCRNWCFLSEEGQWAQVFPPQRQIKDVEPQSLNSPVNWTITSAVVTHYCDILWINFGYTSWIYAFFYFLFLHFPLCFHPIFALFVDLYTLHVLS